MKEEQISNAPTFTALKPWQKAFIDQYISDPRRNATLAYQTVRPEVAYSSARAAASRLIKNEKITAAIREIEAIHKTADYLFPRIIARLSQIAFNDRYISYPDEGMTEKEPFLPGLEEAAKPIQVTVRHSDSIAACKMLLQLTGTELAEIVNVEGRLAIDAEHNLSPEVQEFFERLRADTAKTIEQSAGDEFQPYQVDTAA